MGVVRDLTHTGDNKNVDIARVSALLSVLAYVGGTAYALAMDLWVFDPAQWGMGWATLAGGNAAWIFARQRYEARIAFSPTEGRADVSGPLSPRTGDGDVY